MKFIFKKAVAAFVCLTILLSCIPCASAFSQAENLGAANYYLLQDIIDLYLEKSLYETDRETLIDTMLYNYLVGNPLMLGALANALLSANDPYSAYFSAQDPLLKETSTSYGITVADSEIFDDDDERKSRPGIYINEVVEGSNAEFAGLLPGDRLVSLDGVNVEGLTTTGLKYLFNAMPYTKKEESESPIYKEISSPDCSAERFMDFSLLMWDFTKEIKMTVERLKEDGTTELVDIHVCKGIAVTKDVYYSINKETSTATIEILAFNSDATFEQFKVALDAIYAADCKNIIIDLRDNHGGYSDATISIASLFLEEGTPLYYTRFRNPDETVLTTARGGDKYDAKQFENFIILTNEETASASELLTYIFREHLDAFVIGKTTFGKALGQIIFNVTTGDSFTITAIEALMLDKTSYNEVGIEPDLYVPDAIKRYEFPTGLSHFNHENYVTITEGAENDAVLALEQRFGILGIMRPERIDGVYDDSVAACTMIYKNVTMNDKKPTPEVTFDMVTKMTATINMYKNMNVSVDSQYDVANLYIKNKSQGKRLAAEYQKAEKDRLAAIEEERRAAEKEYEEEMRAEREALEKEEAEQQDTTAQPENG